MNKDSKILNLIRLAKLKRKSRAIKTKFSFRRQISLLTGLRTSNFGIRSKQKKKDLVPRKLFFKNGKLYCEPIPNCKCECHYKEATIYTLEGWKSIHMQLLNLQYRSSEAINEQALEIDGTFLCVLKVL